MAASRPQEGPSASAPSSSTSNTRSIRRRPSNRQAAFSFLSSIQLDSSTQSPTKHSAGITEDEDEHEYEHENRQQATMSNEMPSTPTLPVVTTHSNNNYAASKLRSDRDLQDTIICSSPITSVPSTPTDIRLPNADNRRSYVGKKEEAATNFLSTISLRGETSDDVDNLSTRASRPPLPPGQDSGYPIAVNRPTAPMAPSQGDLIPHSPVQRSSSTPSLASSWARNTSDSMSETAEPLPSGRHRKTTNLGAHAGRDAQPTHRRSVPNPRHQSTHDVDSSSGLLSTLLARESNAEPQSSSFDLGNTSTHRYMLQKASSRWLGPLTDHVYIKPLIASGTAHIVKKIFRRPSLSIPRHHSYSQSSSHQAVGTSRHSLYRTNSGSTTQLKQPLDTQRHIFYSGEDLANSCVSLGENLNQHAYMLTTKNGSPFAVSSILRYNDDKVPNKRRRRRFDREYLQQITKEALVRKKANSFAHLLTQSNALSSMMYP
ncbi:hypothetical protein BCR41DRAFT_146476 [Lobosporangium transversale]|uniref:Uncharacterized protein n=1 Tax=Lobosporangium transversale TaxID=64571 RepID=A0A1Y2GGP0_9FUNG|nr:hypothetical protein BCR41DRAFT_146476 [Lobosporangium transversale]ORZ08573.1 hypothetical protein BCR41DRAFT_146476 [Lobosporangium transversale]|eukprot:XP_021878501.1 hypothetical protein BCR41DRAFT_146476 [Lobosporangium transversale]